MNKSTKGAIAAGAAAVLLLGGAGSLAYWSDSVDLPGGNIAAGELALSNPSCDEGWVYGPDNAKAGSSVSLIVPGDTIVKECTFTVAASGDNLAATLETPDTVDYTVTSSPAPTTLQLDVDATYVDQEGAPVPAQVTSADDGDTITSTLAVTFPFGDAATINANDTQNLTATLNAITVSLTQTES
ncbi:alternate-type signal peptide domain-containing protein [Nocardioides sp. JQ2195]|uniref:alternate-type signal peptide domain-containing protein n=1 Tax=Nocardioides sp. JQ2195 TaxID=2592334 RepID=UPI00143E3C92|nr:alternate-type signal peptide domain-containing protein [Nocardioides sp. JQ2195]QIX26924.1 alternate-type signal peptide domain-containing protein [Nocardioides sp. JQ2195]